MDRASTDAFSSLNWAEHTLVTGNFVNSVRSEGQASPIDGKARNHAMHIRKADNMLLFKDGSMLLISEREAEHVLRAVSCMPVSDLCVCMANLAMCRWTAAGPVSAWGNVPLSVGPLPYMQQTQPLLTRAIVCVQAFNGETEYVRDSAASEFEVDGNRARRDALLAIVFGTPAGRSPVQFISDRIFGVKPSLALLRERADAVEGLAEVRGRGQCWPGSDLEGICEEEITRVKFSRHCKVASRPG